MGRLPDLAGPSTKTIPPGRGGFKSLSVWLWDRCGPSAPINMESELFSPPPPAVCGLFCKETLWDHEDVNLGLNLSYRRHRHRLSRAVRTPRHLRDSGAAFYQQMLAETDIASADDLAVLTRAAECLDRISAAQASIAEHGEIVTDQYNSPRLTLPATWRNRRGTASLRPCGCSTSRRSRRVRAGSTVQCGGRPMDGDELNRRIEEICTERGLTFAPWECPPWECDEGHHPGLPIPLARSRGPRPSGYGDN